MIKTRNKLFVVIFVLIFSGCGSRVTHDDVQLDPRIIGRGCWTSRWRANIALEAWQKEQDFYKCRYEILPKEKRVYREECDNYFDSNGKHTECKTVEIRGKIGRKIDRECYKKLWGDSKYVSWKIFVPHCVR